MDPAPGAADGAPKRRHEPFAESMERQPHAKDRFWYVKQWVTHKIDAPDPPLGNEQQTQTFGVKPPPVAKPTIGGFGCSPLFDQFHGGADVHTGRPMVLGQQSI